MRLILLVSILAACACAQRPENIAAADIGPNPYTGYNCSQLAAEELSITQELANLSADQNRAANGDAFGVFLLGLPVSSMTGADQETNIAIARGRLQAIDETQLTLRCG
ncbi:hypothetical protein [Gymnodinialimonas ceratoperidinii]|uniref:Lipoprotein n=1 Tax=Gymnodinialimonas ceratoperidinii TaxID=2856823 RepID=A0A8F6TVF8_9RHOB|nr:hypothetical protein [Gymnodinialimonas ceratoperidinii]QXT39425.1 hypothetical protein KYE46_16110 [Gymnodinialimonas ceratoperidinii]